MISTQKEQQNGKLKKSKIFETLYLKVTKNFSYQQKPENLILCSEKIDMFTSNFILNANNVIYDLAKIRQVKIK